MIPCIIAGEGRWETVAGEDTDTHIETQDFLEGLFDLRHHIETRYRNVQETITARDRRYRECVMRGLYSDGEMEKVESWEKHFELSERKVYVANNGS